jgi:hypothetical protein
MLPSHKTIENFTIGDIDIGAIKNLSLLADSLMKDGKLIIPGGLKLSGPLEIGDWKISNDGHLRFNKNGTHRYTMHNPTTQNPELNYFWSEGDIKAKNDISAVNNISALYGNVSIGPWKLESSGTGVDRHLQYKYNNVRRYVMHNAETPASIKYGFYSDNNITSADGITVGGDLTASKDIKIKTNNKLYLGDKMYMKAINNDQIEINKEPINGERFMIFNFPENGHAKLHIHNAWSGGDYSLGSG